jgi:hypothetical protein
MPTFLFLNKPFLLGLFAAAIPVLIHLFTRKKAKKLDFSTVDFIRDVARRETKRLRLGNLLIMILRMAAIAAFVLAMARPAFVGPLIKGRGSTAVVVVLDNSASMGSLKERRNLFSYGCDVAREIFGGLGEKDEGSLIPVCGAPEGAPESAALVAGPARLTGMVQLVGLSNGSSSPRQALALAYSLLDGSKEINKELYVVSDFQASQWQELERSQLQGGQPEPQPEQRSRGQLRNERLQRKGIRTALVPISQSPTDSPAGFPLENLSIEKAEIVPLPVAREQMLEFVVVNHGLSSARGVPVRLLSDGKEIAVKYLDVEPGSGAKASLKLALDSREMRAREINICLPPDVFPLDNTYFLAVQPPRQIDVLVVSDEQASQARKIPGEGASGIDFVSLALRPVAMGGTGNLWGFIPHRVATDELSETNLRRAKCVILENVSRLSGRGLDLLKEFKDSGGTLLIVLGDKVDIRYYNERLLPALFPARLVGVEGTSDGGEYGQGERRGEGQRERQGEGRVQERGKGQGSFFSLVATIASHPILRSFDVSRGEAVSGARFYRLIRAEGLEESRVVAEFSQGLPAILEANGALLFTSSFEPEWNDLVVSGAFLPLLHEMLRYLCGAGSLVGRDFHPGDVMEEELPPGQEASVSLVDPAGKELRISKTKLGTSLLVRSEPMNELGTYRLLAGDEELSAFGVNIDPAESRLEALSKRELLKIFGGASIIGQDSRSELAGVARPGQEMWPFFLLLCLGFLVAELLVARSIAPPE